MAMYCTFLWLPLAGEDNIVMPVGVPSSQRQVVFFVGINSEGVRAASDRHPFGLPTATTTADASEPPSSLTPLGGYSFTFDSCK